MLTRTLALVSSVRVLSYQADGPRICVNGRTRVFYPPPLPLYHMVAFKVAIDRSAYGQPCFSPACQTPPCYFHVTFIEWLHFIFIFITQPPQAKARLPNVPEPQFHRTVTLFFRNCASDFFIFLRDGERFYEDRGKDQARLLIFINSC